MMRPRDAALSTALCVLLTALPPPAAAAPATPDQVAAVQRELNDWFHGFAGGSVLMPHDYKVRPQPQGDVYALTASLTPQVAATGHLARQDDGRWHLLDLALPSPAMFKLTGPNPAPDKHPAPPITRSVAFSAARQETTGTLDPSFATPSTVEQRVEAYKLAVASDDVVLLSQIAHVTGQRTLNPATAGRLDVASETSADGVMVDQRRKQGLAFHVTADRAHVTSLVANMSRDRGPQFLHAVEALYADRLGKRPLDAASPHVPFNAEQRERARVILDTLQGLASDATVDIEVTGVHVQSGGSGPDSVDAALRRVRMGGEVRSSDDVLTAHLDLDTEGLSAPQLKGSPYADLVPTRFHLRPSLSGIGTKEMLAYLRQLLDTASHEHAPPPSPAPLLAHGDVTAGLDALSFDFGPASFDGHGTVTLSERSGASGEGQVVATGLDPLIDRVKQDPSLQTVLAALTIAKGIGQANGNQTTWAITYHDGKALVNGIDLTSLMGAAGLGDPQRTPSGPGQ